MVALEPAFVRLQVETVLDDFDVRSVKTGMLANGGHRGRGGQPAAAGSPPAPRRRPGPRLLDGPPPSGARRHRRLPRTAAPPRPGRHPQPAGGRRPRRTPRSSALVTLEARVAVAEQIRPPGHRYVVVKGGHLTESADDVVAGPDGHRRCSRTAASTTGNDHGTGCSLSAAVAAHLARGTTCSTRDRSGQGLRGPGPGRGRRLAPRRRARPDRPFRVVGRGRRLEPMTLHDCRYPARRPGGDAAEPRRPPTPGGISHAPGHGRPRSRGGDPGRVRHPGHPLLARPGAGQYGGRSERRARAARSARTRPPTLLSPIVSAGEPPSNIVNAVVRPGRARCGSRTRTTARAPANSTRRWCCAPTRRRARSWRSSPRP